MKRGLIFFLFFIFFVVIVHGFAQERIRLVRADSLISETVDNQEVWTWEGDVQLVQGDAYIHCGWARLWEEENRALLRDRVTIYDGKRTLKADRIDYSGRDRIESGSGHVSLESNQRVLTAQRIDYFQDEERAFAFGDVVITDLIENITLTGDCAEYNRRLDYGLVEGHPQLVGVDSTSGEQITVTGLKMEAWGEEQRVLVSDSVQIKKGDLTATCQSADYRSDADLLVMINEPVLWYREQEMRGNTIQVRFDRFRFQGGQIYGDATVVSMDSLFQDLLKGETITIVASDDTIHSVIVEEQASSIYHIFNEQDEYQGMNSVTGDRIVLMLHDDRIEKITVESDPGLSTGTYIPNAPPEKTESENRTE
ncbi:hypothetical protein JW824_15405 [bacterium]|nr:hypothetical protein [bacterium]